MRAGLLGCVGWICAALPLAASASDIRRAPGGGQAAQDSTDWIVSIGGMAQYGPLFDGSKRFGVTGLPSFGVRKASEPVEFSAPDDGLDVTLFGDKNFKAGPVFNLRPGRSASADRRLAGLTNYPWTIESGLFAEYWPVEDRLRLRAELRHGFRRDDGFVADIAADVVHKINRWTFSVGPRLALMDRPVARLTFGVTPADAARNGLLPLYAAKAGVKSAGVMLVASYDLSEAWRVTAYHRYDRLLASAADSPITRKIGSRDQFTFGLGATYSFRTGALW